jgi:hypothetical protein
MGYEIQPIRRDTAVSYAFKLPFKRVAKRFAVQMAVVTALDAVLSQEIEHFAAADWVKPKVQIKAIDDTMIPHGDVEFLMEFVGLDVESIKNWIK